MSSAWPSAATRWRPPIPGSWSLEQPARELAAYIYTDKPIYRPGHTVHIKAVLRWRQLDALAPLRSA